MAQDTETSCCADARVPDPNRRHAPVIRRALSIRGLRRRRSGPTSLSVRPPILWNARMFVGDEVLLEVSFAVACERLTQLTDSGALITTSEDSYSRETGALTRVGAIGLSRLFPVLDADVRLTPAGEHVTLLSMAGSYRPPLGSLGQALDRVILHRVATATIRGFVAQVAARIDGGQPGGSTETPAPNGVGSSPPVGEGPC